MKVLNIKRDKYYPGIIVDFEKNGKKGTFSYSFYDKDSGISECNYKEEHDEDIYAEIHDWIDKNVTALTIIKYNGEEIK